MDGGKFVSGVEKIFGDFKRRRIGLIKAFTSDFDEFYQQCDPGKQNLTLHGHPNKKWEVRLPTEMLPSELPEPTLGINFARDAMEMKNWLSLVAIHSDSWLLSVAYFKAGQSGFDKEERERLFDKINNLSTLFDIVDTEFEESSVSTSTSSNSGKSKLSQTKKKTKAKCLDTRSSSLRQTSADRLASHLKDLKLNTMSYKQDMNINLPASESEVVSDSDEEQYRIENVGNSQVSGSNTSTETTGKKKQKKKKKQSKVPGTSQSESSASVVRDLSCFDLASDLTVRPWGPTTFSQASPATH